MDLLAADAPGRGGCDQPGPASPVPLTPQMFAACCRDIVQQRHGHDAHRALDLLTNELLAALGYGEGIAIFERAVSRWHQTSHGYPYGGPCPDCEGSGR